MTDLEKVIKGLECCLSGQPEGLGCDRVPCPYNKFEDCEGMLHRDALALLKATGPVKPIIQRGWYRCGNCRNGIASVLDTGKPSHQQTYCDMCGQKVKWDG